MSSDGAPLSQPFENGVHKRRGIESGGGRSCADGVHYLCIQAREIAWRSGENALAAPS